MGCRSQLLVAPALDVGALPFLPHRPTAGLVLYARVCVRAHVRDGP